MAEKTIKTRIQLIRNFTTTLEEKNPTTLNGEFYVCINPSTNITKFKIGDGRKFNEIPYYEDNLLKELGIDDTVITKADNQILVFNGTSGKWENEKFTDGKSLEYSKELGLFIKGYNEAESGKFPVKDSTDGIKWITPLDRSALDAAVNQANISAQQAGQSAIAAGNSAIQADTAAQTAELINQTTMNWVNNKFWWGTLEEYNALTEVIEGTFYFIRL